MRKNGLKLIVATVASVIVLTGCGVASTIEKEEIETEVNVVSEMNNENMEEEIETGMETEVVEGTSHEMGMDEDGMEEEMMTNEGEVAPDFEFVDTEGNIYTNDTFLGEKVYLKYWASWCSICLAGLDEIDELFTEAEGFTIYTVVTPGQVGELDQEEFEEWFAGIEQKNIKVLYDMGGIAAQEFGVRAFPTSIFIGSDGVVISVTPGHKSNESIIQTIDSIY